MNIRRQEKNDCSGIAHVVTLAWNEAYKDIVSRDFLDNLYVTEHDRADEAYKKFNKRYNHQFVLDDNGEVVGFVNVGRAFDEEFDGYGEIFALYIINGYKNSDDDYYGSDIPVHPMTDSGGTANINIVNDSRFWGDGRMFAIETKNGAAIFIRAYRRAGVAQAKQAAIAEGCTYYTNAADVVIDVNGKNAPNVFGRDIFWFALGENGVLYPYGGKDVARVEGGDAGEWDEVGNNYTCQDDNKGSNANVKGIGCTARVIAEGYKINY